MNLLYEEYKWDGVVVVGGGCTGILTALEISKKGVPVLIIETRFLAGGQTAHSHGWVHQGYIFPDIKRNELEILRLGSTWWKETIAELEIRPISRQSVIGFSTNAEAQEHLAKWDALGMSYEQTEPLNNSITLAYKTPEWAVSPLAVLQSIYTKTSGISIIYAKVIAINRIIFDDSASLVIEIDGERVVLYPGSIVLAAGNGIKSIITRHSKPPDVITRKSFMLVVKTDSKLPHSFALPEKNCKGLFAVKRFSREGEYILISNFMSYDCHNNEDIIKGMWIDSILNTLKKYVPQIFSTPDCSYGYYPAEKIEPFKKIALGVPLGTTEQFLSSNTVLAIPGKFTLSPVVAQAAASMAISKIIPARKSRNFEKTHEPIWSYEDWQMIPMSKKIENFYEK